MTSPPGLNQSDKMILAWCPDSCSMPWFLLDAPILAWCLDSCSFVRDASFSLTCTRCHFFYMLPLHTSLHIFICPFYMFLHPLFTHSFTAPDCMSFIDIPFIFILFWRVASVGISISWFGASALTWRALTRTYVQRTERGYYSPSVYVATLYIAPFTPRAPTVLGVSHQLGINSLYWSGSPHRAVGPPFSQSYASWYGTGVNRHWSVSSQIRFLVKPNSIRTCS